MINLYYNLQCASFTKEIKDHLDSLIEELPYGSHVFFDVTPTATPFSEFDLEDQIRGCYSPDINKCFIFEEPKGTSIDIKKKNSSESCENSEELVFDLIVNSKLEESAFSPQVLSWLTDWMYDTEELRGYYRFVVLPLSS